MITLGERTPSKAPDTWIAPDAVIIGDVDLYDRVRALGTAVLLSLGTDTRDCNIDLAHFRCKLRGAQLSDSNSPTSAHPVQVSVWSGAVLRGDLNNIRVFAWSCIGDRTVIHAAR